MNIRLILASTAILAFISNVSADEYRAFTNKEGTSIKAKIIRAHSNGQKITVQREGQRKQITVPTSAFDDVTQKYIKCWIQNSDFLNERLLTVECDKIQSKVADKSTTHEWTSGAGVTDISHTELVYYGHHVDIDFENKSDQTFSNVSVEYTIYYNQETSTEIKTSKYKKETQHGTSHKKTVINLSPKSKHKLSTDAIVLKKFCTDASNEPKLEGELDGIIIHISLHTESGETITREIIYPEKLKQSWTPETKDVQPPAP